MLSCRRTEVTGAITERDDNVSIEPGCYLRTRYQELRVEKVGCCVPCYPESSIERIFWAEDFRFALFAPGDSGRDGAQNCVIPFRG